MKAPLLCALLVLIFSCAVSDRPLETTSESTAPVELGAVRWHRNLFVAQEEAKRRDAPILLLLQEVPG